MKVLKFTLFFPLLFCGFTEFLYGKTPAGTMDLPNVAHPFPSLYYALARDIPSAGNAFVNAAEAFERDHFRNTEGLAGSIPVGEQLLLNSDPKNKAPKAHAGNYKDLTDEDGNGKESLQLDGSRSSDKDGHIVSYSWTIEGTNSELATGVNPVANFSVGSTWIVLTVTDNGGLTDSEKVKIKIKEGKEKDDGGKGQDDKDKDDKDKGDKDKDEKDKDDDDKGGKDKDEKDKDDDDKGDDKDKDEENDDNEDDKDKDEKDKDDDDKGDDKDKDEENDDNEDDKDKDDDKDDDEDKDDDGDNEDEEDPANKAPVADAGKDMQLKDEDNDGKETVKLNGSKSKDEDGTIESYSWSLAGTEIAEGKNPSVSLETGSHTVKLTVTDNEGLTDTDEVQISISAPANKGPEANAGPDQEKTDTDRNGKETIELDGSASKDPDGSIEKYSWKVKGDEIATGAKPVVELSTGTTTIELTVTDNDGSTATDKVKITIKEAPNQAPVAHAGENQTLTTEGGAGTAEVKLDGSASTDADGEIENYSWSVGGKEIATGKEPTVSLATGVHTITLTVTDNEGSTDTDEAEITINKGESEDEDEDEDEDEEEKPANKAPVARAGADQELTDTDGNGKETVKLDATASTDEDGSITSYSWSIEGSETVLATGATPEAELPTGSNTIVLKVTDEEGATHTDTVVILIKEKQEEEDEDEETGGEENEDTGGEGDGEGTEGGEETEGEENGGDDGNGGEAGNAFLPNLFSPNGDNMNDEFTLEATHVAEVHWRIYNRQGRLVYETQDVKEATETGWDGNAFGGPQPAGSYVWILEGSYEDGSPILIDGEIKGNVTLIR